MSDLPTDSSVPQTAALHPACVTMRTLVTTGIVSALAGFAGAVLFTHYLLKPPEAPQAVAVVDMVKVGAAVTKLSLTGAAADAALRGVADRIRALRDSGVVVIDARYVIAAPEAFVLKPSALIVGASDTDAAGSGYMPPDLLAPVPGLPQTQERPERTERR